LPWDGHPGHLEGDVAAVAHDLRSDLDLACFIDWRPFLAPGERATIMVIAADRKQARVIMRYVLGLLEATRC